MCPGLMYSQRKEGYLTKPGLSEFSCEHLSTARRERSISGGGHQDNWLPGCPGVLGRARRGARIFVHTEGAEDRPKDNVENGKYRFHAKFGNLLGNFKSRIL